MSDRFNTVEKVLIGFFVAGLVVLAVVWAMTGERPGFGGLVPLGLILLAVVGARTAKASGNDDARR